MLEFRVHQLEVGGKHYLPLPKLNTRQIKLLGDRLAQTGFSVNYGDLLTARSKAGRVSVSRSGICWSSLDPSDAILPAVPQILSIPKEDVSLEALRRMYLRTPSYGNAGTVHLLLRLESTPVWEKLRALDGCGLTPDEHFVISFLLEGSIGGCGMLTDFPVTNPRPRIYGRRRYFDSELDPQEAASTLRRVGERGERNSYVRRDGTIILGSHLTATRVDWMRLFAELGEWCSFRPR